MSGWPQKTVWDLQQAGILLVEDGNHGEYRPRKNEFCNDGRPFIRPPDLVGGRVDFKNADMINDDAVARVRKGKGRAGDILFSHRATVGRMARVGMDAPEFIANPGITIYRCLDDEALDRGFLYFWMQHAEFMDQVWAVAGSTDTFPYASLTEQRKLLLRVPHITEQREIAAVLGALDDKIEVNRKTAVTLEEMARALYRSWFVDFDPVHAKAAGRAPAHMPPQTAALFPDSFGEDGLPDGWSEEPIIEQSDWVNGAAYKNMHFEKTPDALPVVKIAELKAGITANTKFTATDLGERYRFGRGDLLFSWSGNPDTSIDAFVWAHGDAWLNQHIFAVRPNGKTSKAALFSMLKFYMPEFAEIARNKQTTGLGHITRKDLEAFPVRIAPSEVMAIFEQEIGPMFERYCLTLYENQTLATLRDMLLPRLMSGELRVGDAPRILEEME